MYCSYIPFFGSHDTWAADKLCALADVLHERYVLGRAVGVVDDFFGAADAADAVEAADAAGVGDGGGHSDVVVFQILMAMFSNTCEIQMYLECMLCDFGGRCAILLGVGESVLQCLAVEIDEWIVA